MVTINAIYKNGVFRPLDPVDLPQGCTVQFELRFVNDDSDDGMDAIYEVMDRHYNSGEHDLAERHNEHQP
ncbi:MAG: antitoxin family protein [Pirellulales bacterium]